jgi:hypothetical protein
MAFTDVWGSLRVNLRGGTVIPNWTVKHGPLGDDFKIVDVADDVVIIDAPRATKAQQIPRANFEEVYNRWDDYRRGALPRSFFTPVTRYSKYIISIMHWLEGQSAGQLP